MYKDTLSKYLDDLAAKLPAPGGGSAAALTAATGAALISMVANFTVGKEKYKSAEGQIKSILSSSESLRKRLTDLVDEDAGAYKRVSAAYKLPKACLQDKRKRAQAIQKALREALAAPLEICKCSYEAAKFCPVLMRKANSNLVSDAGVAVVLLASAFQSALFNIQINLKGIKDDKFILGIREIIEPMEKEMFILEEEVKNGVKKHLTGGNG